MLYRLALRALEPDRELHLAVHEGIYRDLFSQPHGEELCVEENIRLIVFDQTTEEILKWIP